MPLSWGVYLVMSVSVGLITGGVALLAIGWDQVFRARHQLATTGLYGEIRHPQYLGLILIVIAFNIQWPTLPTLAMAPVLIVMYVRQARREDRELAARFGEEFVRYASRVPAFIPRFHTRRGFVARRDRALTSMAGPAREGAAGEKAE
jgi:protein-S-isoprenylcysteine O-methyltransferase Ste14